MICNEVLPLVHVYTRELYALQCLLLLLFMCVNISCFASDDYHSMMTYYNCNSYSDSYLIFTLS